MMLRNLLDDIVRRRLWPLLAVAALVAVAAPLLFLKSAPDGAPAAETAAPAVPETAKLPARAARLLATDDAAGASGRTKGKSRDPFAPSATQGAPAAPAATSVAAVKSSSTTAKKSASKPIPVVIKNADGSSTSSGSTAGNDTSSNGGEVSSRPSNALTAETAAVAVRFSKTVNGKLHRAIPSKQAFFIRGKLVAVFVKYSPSRHKAVFAVAPGIHVSGPIQCRVVDGVCRFLDIPAGSYARLTMLTAKREIVRRRLDVEHITRRSEGERASAASSSDANACLLHKLEAMKLGSALVDRDACKR